MLDHDQRDRPGDELIEMCAYIIEAAGATWWVARDAAEEVLRIARAAYSIAPPKFPLSVPVVQKIDSQTE